MQSSTKDAWQQEALYIRGTALRIERILTPLRTQTLHSLREHTHNTCKRMPSAHPINTNYNLQLTFNSLPYIIELLIDQ